MIEYWLEISRFIRLINKTYRKVAFCWLKTAIRCDLIINKTAAWER